MAAFRFSRSTRRCRVYYLFVDTELICKWCREPLIQVVEDDPDKVIVRLCPICDKWPPGFMDKEKK